MSAKSPPKKLLAIINPISGYARSRQLPIVLARRLAQEGLTARFHWTTGPRHAANLARQEADKFDAVIVAGGDGTISEVVQGLAGKDKPIILLPTGTENLLAKELKISSNIDALIAAIKMGTEHDFDLGKVNDKHFLLISGVGFDAQVLNHLIRYRTGNITHLTYFWPIWRTFWEYRFPPISVWVDGQQIFDNQPGLVFVSNINRYAVGLRICMHARCDDGLLDVCIYPCDHQWPLLVHAWRTTWRKHLDKTGAIYRQGKSIRIESTQTVPFQTDGDPAGYLPAHYSIVPHQVKILTPPEGF